jgi:hypothetical protein
MAHHDPIVDVFYRPEMTAPDASGNYSKSPTKPKRFVEWLLRSHLAPAVRLREDWEPLSKGAFTLAHTPEYVEGFFAGKEPHAKSNGLAWSPAFAETVRYTNGSLLAATRAALASPARIALSPTSGFHHATPERGGGYCTFSGQVVAAVHVLWESAKHGAWIDLDGHYGNSIEDSRRYVRELEGAIRFNLNPQGEHQRYLASLQAGLDEIGEAVLAGRVDYVCVAHGADSHVDDDLGGQCTTDEWLEASHRTYGAVRRWSEALGRPVPLVLALFGGYRQVGYEGVLRLHAADLAIALDTLTGTHLAFDPELEVGFASP